MLWKAGVAAATLLMLAACGSSTSDRAISGGAIGAGVGGAAGAFTGALTNENDIDLGKPVWKR